MARVTILVGPTEGAGVDLSGDCRIGRGPESTLRINDPGVSRNHVRISQGPSGEFMVEDLGSRNGTMVNGEPVSRSRLRSGDRIQLGQSVLLLFSEHDALEDSMIRAQQMDTIGRLSAGINHDFNNLLCVILSNAAYLRDLPSGVTLGHAEVRECLDDLHAAAASGAQLTARLSAFAQAPAISLEPVNFSDVCRDTLKMVRMTFPGSIEIHDRIRPGLYVRGALSHLKLLVMNPLLNARDAMPNGGVLSLDLELTLRSEAAGGQPMSADAYITLVIRDTGVGMDKVTLRRAFEPFFTTKDITVGSGLGLPMVRRVTESHGGHVELRSRPGAGTTLRVMLPAVAGATEVAASWPPAGPIPGTAASSTGDAAPEPTPTKQSLFHDDAHTTADDRLWSEEVLTAVLRARRSTGERNASRGVVLVQPDASAARATMRILATADVHVIHESGLDAALAPAAETLTPRWILCDESAASRDRIEAACRDDGHRIILLTASPDKWQGVRHVLRKPLKLEDLLPLLEE